MSSDSDQSNGMSPMTDNYNNLNKSQSTAWEKVKPLFAKAMTDFLGSANDENENDGAQITMRVADLGCATGGNSVAPLGFIGSQLRSRFHAASYEIFVVDLPQNSWGSVVSTVNPTSIARKGSGNIAADGNTAEEHLATQNTFVYMVGRTFYDQCAPDGSLDLSYSLVAVHWMKSYAGDLPSGLYATDSSHVPEPDLLKAWRDAGHQDWLDFTKARHKELKIGGKFIGVVAAPKENGDQPWSQVGKLLYDVLCTKVDNPSRDLATCVLPVCWRTENEVRAGFINDNSDNTFWEVEVCEFHQTKDPIRTDLENGDISVDVYSEVVMDAFAAVCHLTCLNSMSKTMPRDQAAKILDASYKDCLEKIGADPAKYNLDVSFWYILAKKTQQ